MPCFLKAGRAQKERMGMTGKVPHLVCPYKIRNLGESSKKQAQDGKIRRDS
jgi:hypothetical protein